jgi:broad specificity phosphatase PhoE/8-oxo-dGTP pyrophosphatase MutT (NUDIX family)
VDVSEVVRAAGGVVWQPVDSGGVEVVLVHRPAYDDWSFPKGKLHPGEVEAAAALREVEEEAGLRCRLGRELGVTAYQDSAGRPKTVRYWEMTAVDGEPTAANEVDDARWVAADDATALLTYDRDRELLSRFRDLVARPRTEARPIYVIRHAKAGKRERWTGPDELRPLTRAGRRQAEALVGLFAELPLSQLLSSPYVRCVQTLEPLAEARRLPVKTVDALAEGADVGDTFGLVRELAGEGNSALCTHGDVIELLVDELARRDVPLVSSAPIELAKGSTLVLDVVPDGHVVEARYVPPQ